MNSNRSFKLGYSTITWDQTPDYDEVLGTISDAGWEGVEFIRGSLDWMGTPKRMRGLLDKYGLKASALLGGVSIDADAYNTLERAKRKIEFASEIGAKIFAVTGAKRVEQRLPSDDDFKKLGEVSDHLIDHASQFGLTVAYHAHPLCTVETEEEQDQLLSYTDRLQICLDVSVSARMGEDPIPQIRKYRDRLAYVHMKDDGFGKFCIMGQGKGDLDFGLIRETLNEVGYKGWVTGELSPYADTPAVESCYENMRYLKSVGY